jgi:DNA-binding NtrC family response regulator
MRFELKMNVLIVESDDQLRGIWADHLRRLGAQVFCASSQDGAVAEMQHRTFDIIVLDLVLEDGSAFAVADFAAYRSEQTRVVFVTNTTFFSDGSIYKHIPNACAFVQSSAPPEDLAAIVEHYAGGN